MRLGARTPAPPSAAATCRPTRCSVPSVELPPGWAGRAVHPEGARVGLAAPRRAEAPGNRPRRGPRRRRPRRSKAGTWAAGHRARDDGHGAQAVSSAKARLRRSDRLQDDPSNGRAVFLATSCCRTRDWWPTHDPLRFTAEDHLVSRPRRGAEAGEAHRREAVAGVDSLARQHVPAPMSPSICGPAGRGQALRPRVPGRLVRVKTRGPLGAGARTGEPSPARR